ncbi:MAG TPA: NADH-quinone oxidoreductase subunit N, partial [Trueperaceae bacterium]
LAPVLTLLVTAAVGLLVALGQQSGKAVALLCLAGLVVSALFTVRLFAGGGAENSFGLRYLADTPSLAFDLVILLGTALAILTSYDYLGRAELAHTEYYPLMLLSACGAMVMAAAGDLITLLLGLEIMSLAVYVLSAWREAARESEEAGMKYFLLGAFASAFLIYGIALMYGATGHFGYAQAAAAIAGAGFDQPLLALLAGVFLLGGLAFKAALAPFHQWSPDVYTGAPTPVTAFMSVVVKTAAFAALLRVFAVVFPGLSPVLSGILAVLVALTLVIGNLAALWQRGVKRMLGYSAVAHAGYLGLAVLAAPAVGMQAAVFYLSAYAFMNIGAFAVLSLISDKNDHGDDLVRFAGLGRSRPYLAATLALFLLSLAGIPPLAGFAGKILVFQAALGAGYYGLAVLAILTSAVAVVYYFRVVAYMYFRESEYPPPAGRSTATNLAIAIAVLGTVLLGILPGWWYGLLDAGQRLVAGL